MSSKNQMIFLEAPLYGGLEEHIVSRGHTCRYCYGEGGFGGDPRLGEVWTPCPVCKGRGKMEAELTIKSKASEKVKEKKERERK